MKWESILCVSARSSDLLPIPSVYRWIQQSDGAVAKMLRHCKNAKTRLHPEIFEQARVWLSLWLKQAV